MRKLFPLLLFVCNLAFCQDNIPVLTFLQKEYSKEIPFLSDVKNSSCFDFPKDTTMTLYYPFIAFTYDEWDEEFNTSFPTQIIVTTKNCTFFNGEIQDKELLYYFYDIKGGKPNEAYLVDEKSVKERTHGASLNPYFKPIIYSYPMNVKISANHDDGTIIVSLLNPLKRFKTQVKEPE